jgi:hypothetical protein
MKPFEQWTVLPHSKLTQVDDGLLTLVGDLPMPTGDFPRRMTVVRLADGRLVVYSAISLDDDEMKQLERYGTPAFLIVPSDIHRMDAKTWKDRYPDIVVVAPAGACDKIREVVNVDATTIDFGDTRVHFVTVPGTEKHEAALVVERADGATLVVNDVIWNVDHRRGFGGLLLRLLGFTGGGPKIPKLVALKGIKDRKAFKEQLERWAALPLRRIIVSHGEIITGDPPTVLRGLAAKLAA